MMNAEIAACAIAGRVTNRVYGKVHLAIVSDQFLILPRTHTRQFKGSLSNAKMSYQAIFSVQPIIKIM